MRSFKIFLLYFIFFLIISSQRIISKCYFKMGFIPSENVLIVLNQYSKFIKYISDKINCKIEPHFFNSYKDLSKDLELNHLDAAMISPLVYVNIRNKTNYEVFARTIRENKKSYRSEIITLKNSNINSLMDLKGKTIGFVDEQSCSGYLYPILHLAENHIYPGDFKQKKLNTHDNVLYATLYGQVDAGAVFEGAEKKFLDKNEIKKLKILAFTNEIITDPIVIKKNLDSNLKKKVITSILNCPRKFLPESITKFIKASDKEYEDIKIKLNNLKKLMNKK